MIRKGKRASKQNEGLATVLTSVFVEKVFYLFPVDHGPGLPVVGLRVGEVVVEGQVELPVVLGQTEQGSLLAGLSQGRELSGSLPLRTLQTVLEKGQEFL